MVKVRFTADFDYKPLRSITTAYLAGMVITVKRDCADKAIAAGKAAVVPRNSKNNGDGNGGE